MFARVFLLAFASMFIVQMAVAFGQTTLNPDISLVGDVRAFTHNDKIRPSENNEFNLQSPDMEIIVAGYLNPYARADAVLAWEDGANAEVEELYATILRGLPLNLNLRVGKYRLEFGRINPVHPHAYSFLHQPLPHEVYFGEEGLNNMAVRASFTLPTGPLYTEVMGAVLKGEVLSGEEAEITDDPIALAKNAAIHQDETLRIKPGFFVRAATSGALSESAELSTGASFVTAEYDRDKQLRARVVGVDAKYKWKPNRNTSLTIEGEFLSSHREMFESEAVNANGVYGYIDYRFRQKYNAGSMFEYSQDVNDASAHVSRIAGFAGFAPIEETTLIRLAGDWTEPNEGEGFWTLTLQFVFSLGPHQPHNF